VPIRTTGRVAGHRYDINDLRSAPNCRRVSSAAQFLSGGGAPKTGTTSLYQHPQMYMSPIKDPNYFGSEIHIESFCEGMSDPLTLLRACFPGVGVCALGGEAVRRRCVRTQAWQAIRFTLCHGRQAPALVLLAAPVSRAREHIRVGLHVQLTTDRRGLWRNSRSRNSGCRRSRWRRNSPDWDGE
jgi:hypothetical protein